MDYVCKWVEDVALVNNDAISVSKYCKEISSQDLELLGQKLSDESCHFCNKMIENLQAKYGAKCDTLYLDIKEKVRKRVNLFFEKKFPIHFLKYLSQVKDIVQLLKSYTHDL